MNNPTQTITKAEQTVEYVPLGADADSRVKLSISIVKHYFATPTKSGKLPSDRDCVRFMLLCKSRALAPAEGDCYLIGFDGQNGPEFSLITAHQAFLKRAEIHPEYDGMESGVIVRDENGKTVDRVGDFVEDGDELVGGWATVHFKTRKHPRKERLRLSIFNKGFGQWKNNAAGMICKCAEASALRTSFPTKLGGLFLRDEIDVKSDGPTLSGSGEFDPPSVTVETGKTWEQEQKGKSPQEEPKPGPVEGEGKTTPPQTPQGDLQAVVEDAGFTFRDLIAWGDETGNITDATSIPDYNAIPTKVAQRLLLAKKGLLKGLEMLRKDINV